MDANVIIALVGVSSTTLISILIFVFYISSRLTKIEGTQKSNRDSISESIKNTRESILGTMKLTLSQELIAIEKRFDEAEKATMNIQTVLAKELQTERHDRKNLELKVNLLAELKERRKDK